MGVNRKAEAETAVRNAIGEFRREHLYGPSFRDISAMTGLPLGTVHETARRLRDQGSIRFLDGVARSMLVEV